SNSNSDHATCRGRGPVRPLLRLRILVPVFVDSPPILGGLLSRWDRSLAATRRGAHPRMRSRGALIRTQSPTCSTAEHDASTLFLAPMTDFDTAQKASTGCMPPWRAASNLSEQSYQLLFTMTVAFLPQFRTLRRPRFIKRGASAVASPSELAGR